MKKQDVAGILAYLVILALAAIFGLFVIREYSPKSGMDIVPFIFFVVGAILSGLLFNSILFEIAHVIGALAGGYQITSVNILGLTFAKDNGKTRVHFSSFDGLTGETKIIPKKDRKKESNPVPYLVFGTLFYSIEVIVVVLVFSILTREGSPVLNTNIGYFLLIMMAVGGMILIYNIIPFQLDSMTDGYRLRLVSGKKNREAFNKMLLGETVEQKEGENTEEVKTSFSHDLKLNQVYQLLSEDKYQEAEEIIDSIIEASATEKKISQKTINEASAQKIYISFVKDADAAIADYSVSLKLQDKKRLSEESDFASLRAYILISSLVDRSHSECQRSLSKVYKAYKRSPAERRHLESVMFNKALDIVISKHQDWDLEEYKIHDEQK